MPKLKFLRHYTTSFILPVSCRTQIHKSNETGETPDKKAPKGAFGSGSALFAKYLMIHVCKILNDTCIVYMNSFFYPFVYFKIAI